MSFLFLLKKRMHWYDWSNKSGLVLLNHIYNPSISINLKYLLCLLLELQLIVIHNYLYALAPLVVFMLIWLLLIIGLFLLPAIHYYEHLC